MAELIVALDVPSRAEVAATLRRLGDAVDFYKIGLELFSAEGPDVVRLVKDAGKRVFLDLKLHDIPRTVERAVHSIGRLGVELATIHASGGRAMIRAAADAAATFGASAPKILAVTCLTSLDQGDLDDLGVARAMPDQVEALGLLAVANVAIQEDGHLPITGYRVEKSHFYVVFDANIRIKHLTCKPLFYHVASCVYHVTTGHHHKKAV